MRRHIDGAGGQNRHVGNEPLETVFGENADSVAGLDADVHQRRRRREGPFAVVAPAQVVVQTVPPVTQRRRWPKTVRLIAMPGCEVAERHRRSLYNEVAEAALSFRS